MSCPYNNCNSRFICLCIPPMKNEHKPLARIAWLADINNIRRSGEKFTDVINSLFELNSNYVDNKLSEVGIEKGKQYTLTPDGCITEIIEDNNDE